MYPVSLLALPQVFRNEIRKITDQLQNGEITLAEWQDRFTNLLARYILAALLLGYETTTPQIEQIAEERLREQVGFLTGFADEIRTSESWLTKWNSRAESYAICLIENYFTGLLLTGGMYRWDYTPEAQHCNDCLFLNGQIHDAAYWIQNHIPGDWRTECKGGCRCLLTRVE